MNRWANNYYTQQAGNDRSTRQPRAPPSGLPSSQSRRGSFGKIADNGVVNLCVFRVAHLTQITLKSFIERQGVQVLNIEQVSHRGAGYKSFVVTVKEKDAPRLLSKNFWPGLVACKLLQDVDPWHNDVFSRRYVRELPFPKSNSENKSQLHGQRVSRVGGAAGHLLGDKPRTVHAVGSQRYGTQNIRERKGKGNNKSHSNNLKKTERRNDNELNKEQKEKLQTSTKNSLTEKRPKITAHPGNKAVTVPTRTTTIRVNRKNSNENMPKEHVSNTVHGRALPAYHNSTRTRKPYLTNFSVGKNRKHKSGRESNRNNSKTEEMSDKKEVSGRRPRPVKSSITSVPSQVSSSYLDTHTVNKKYKNANSNNDMHDSKYTVNKPKGTQPHWIAPLRGLLTISSEEALSRLLGPEFDRLLIQDNITDEEIFLGVKVLAHCARAKVSPNKLQRLVYKICQPQVVFLIKEFTRTVEEKYKARAERYFWDLGEFLDLYIVHNIFINGMLSLFTACLSKTLALNHKKYVSDYLVKVYRGMQTKVFTNLP